MLTTETEIRKEQPFSEAFFAPAFNLLQNFCREEKTTGPMPDARFLRLGLARCLDQYSSGRHFIQKIDDKGQDLARSTYFDALQQPRRLVVIKEVSERLFYSADTAMPEEDWLANVPGTFGRIVMAIDGHQIEHACHALRDPKGKRVPPGSLYALDLHKGLIKSIGPHQGDGRRTHEMKFLKGKIKSQFKKQTNRPIAVGDMGFIDNGFWIQQFLDSTTGPVIITRERSDMKPIVYGTIPFDKKNIYNAGVLNYELIGFNDKATMCRVTYKDPETGADFIFITTDLTLLPGVVALLYRLRWKIEKAFNIFKSKFCETKGWANGSVAQELQTHFLAITHNLLAILRYELKINEGIEEVKVNKVHEKRALVRASKKTPFHCFYEIARIAQQLTCQFIRVVQSLLIDPKPIGESFSLFRERLEKYL